MKNFIVGLMVLSALASCGKNNSVAASATNAIGVSTVSSASLDPYGRVPLTNYIADINNNAFGAARSAVETYQYYSDTGSGSGCTYKSTGGFFSFYYWDCSSSSSSSSSSTYVTVTVDHGTVNLAAKKSELINLIGQTASYSNSSDRKQLHIQTSTGTYTIDFRIPMSANPVSQTNSSGTKYFNYSFAGYNF